VALASDRKTGLWLVIGFAVLHAWFWTFILINLKAAQDVHMDVAEAFAWGQKFQLGYGSIRRWRAGSQVSGSSCFRSPTGPLTRWRWRRWAAGW